MTVPRSKYRLHFVLLVTILAVLGPNTSHGGSVEENQVVIGNHGLVGKAGGVRGLTSATTVTFDTVIVASFSFDAATGGPDPQGWISAEDLINEQLYFHVDDFAGLGGSYAPLKGTKSLWCGVRPAPSTCGYETAPGYGDNWVQHFESVPFATIGNVIFRYEIQWDTEPADLGYAEYRTVSNRWQQLAVYSGAGFTDEAFVILADSVGGSFRARFRFVSDASMSDQDGAAPTDGAIILDELAIQDDTGTIEFEDFDDEAQGMTTTNDGQWSATVGAGVGDFAALVNGTTVFQLDTMPNSTNFWGFSNGSPDDYTCGGFPSVPVVPFPINPSSTAYEDYANNAIRSPIINMRFDESNTPIDDYDSLLVELDVYRDLPLDNLVFYQTGLRWFKDGCVSPWTYPPLLNFGDTNTWDRLTFNLTDLVDVTADSVQISLRVIDYCWSLCPVIGSGACHSNAPLIDNVALLAMLPIVPSGVGDDPPSAPKRLALRQNTPNPFNPTTTIGYDVPPGSGAVTLSIYDVSGRLVRTLVKDVVPTGFRTAVWDGRDAQGHPAASGVYFYRLRAGDFTQTRKMVLLK